MLSTKGSGETARSMGKELGIVVCRHTLEIGEKEDLKVLASKFQNTGIDMKENS